MKKAKKLFLLDAYALIFRAYYAFINNPMSNSKGLSTSAVFGFTLALDDVLRKEDPTHIAVVFDPSGPTFRHELFPDYKANRDATPDDIKTAVPYIKKLLQALRIPAIEVPGYEADDVIGTLSKKAEKEGFTVFMMTPDKDYAQLVSPKIFMYKPGRRGDAPDLIGPDEVKQKFHVEHPHQVIDILALWGDASDNIPGAPGIGEKTAKKLIRQYHSVEGVYQNIEELKGKQKENLQTSKDQVFLSKTLATIVQDLDVALNPSELERKEANAVQLRDLFGELEFKMFDKRFLKPESGQARSLPDANGAASQQTLFAEEDYGNLNTCSHDYKLIVDLDGVRKLVSELEKLEGFCFDTETTGLDPLSAELLGLAISWEAHKAYYIAFPENRDELLLWLNELAEVFRNGKIWKSGQNLKYDLHILKNYEIEVKGELFDTMLAHFLLKPEQKHNLNVLAEQYLSYRMQGIEELIGEKGRQQGSFRNVELEKAKEYAGEDADITWQLTAKFRELLKKDGLEKLASELEMPLVPVLMEMEHHGVSLDLQALDHFAASLRNDLIAIEKEIYELAGIGFNIGSPKQLGEILFERLKIVKDPKRTKTRQYATGEEVLLSLSDKHPIVDKVLEYRSLRKLLNTYVEALPKLIHPETGRIHTSFNQALVSTGRLSSAHPNLQNIPIREERGREIRRAFIPGNHGHCFLSADYSQIELRIMAHLSQDRAMIEAFRKNVDIHRATAARIYKIDVEEVSREQRSKAKTANFGIIYGISAFGLSQRMRIPRTEAKSLIDGYFESYPDVRRYMDASIQAAREHAYVETLFGRRRYLPDILSRNAVVRGNAERNAINSPIQGSAADIIKIAMINISRAMHKAGMKSRMILQVHDELNFDVAEGELDPLSELVRAEMENAVKLDVPLVVELGSGANWLEAH